MTAMHEFDFEEYVRVRGEIFLDFSVQRVVSLVLDVHFLQDQVICNSQQEDNHLNKA